MKPVPEEYVPTVETACAHLVEGAKLIMFIAVMLGGDKFELDTPDGFKVMVKVNPEFNKDST